MITYARNDAHHLQPLADILGRQLTERGRLEWHAQMCQQLIVDATRPPDDNGDDAWRIKSADHLSRRGMVFLRELWHWRDREAVAGNRPPFFVLSHDTLFNLAVAAANGSDVSDLIPRRYSPRRRASLDAALERAGRIPEEEWPVARTRRGERLSMAQKHQLDRLRHRRDRAADRLELDPTLIASRGMLVRLAANWEQHVTELLPWQRGLLEA
jgi:ribonuclease D